jgi:hypothetical protein
LCVKHDDAIVCDSCVANRQQVSQKANAAIDGAENTLNVAGSLTELTRERPANSWWCRYMFHFSDVNFCH